VERKAIVTKKLLAVLIIVLALRNVSLSQQTSVPEIPASAVLTCRTVQLQSEDGKPVADVPVHLKGTQIKMMKGNAAGADVTFKVLKKLKTDAAGKVQLPELKPDTYYLALPEAKKFTSGPFIIPDDSKPGDCTQAFVLRDKDNMVAIEPAVPAKAADKK
jgi:hypothetical protein